MERNKMEQDIKKKLDARSITPTPMAWDRLDAMLSVAEKKETKKKPLVMWLSMAACFVALLFAGIFYLNSEGGNVKNEIDNGSTVVSAQEKEVESTIPSVVKEEIIVERVAPKAEAPVAVTTKHSNKVQHKTANVKQSVIGFAGVTPSEPEVAVTTPEVEKPAAVRPSKIKVDANVLLASVDKPSQNNTAQPGTPQKSAVAVAPGPAKKTIDVNANTLLTSVEGELDQSFRGKVINSIQKNYNTVKTAVATRNRE
ncbi:hypothetical protein ACLI09_10385 [Flavobacterium sp. RHBU_24]|uniref:hypothetical protein n=1 Tax=Flavobacterium sp. RHBU_24 TaxID=3391185 RepID=UPI0039852144